LPFSHVSGRIVRALARRWSSGLEVGALYWDALDRELDRSGAANAIFWWRDDDAVAATPQLLRLLSLRDELDIPLSLAVISALAEPNLATVLNVCSREALSILVHGWDHSNHAGPGEPEAEFAPRRRPSEVAEQLVEARRRLESQFGNRVLPVLVPPWNRLSPHLIDGVRSAGFTHVSVEGDFAGLRIPARNVHADVMDWNSGSGMDGARLVGDIIVALRLRRYGAVGRCAPIGILTHHSAHDEGAWLLTATLLERLKRHPAVVFLEESELWKP
jgi:hypothetical protein